ncbi:MAG: AAA family ATPase [Armatimonas sp.]
METIGIPLASIPVVIIVTGSPGTGKTTLSNSIAEALSLPLLHRDGLQEVLYDTLGFGDTERSHAYGVAGYGLLYLILEALLKARVSCIIESNFISRYASPTLRDLQERYDFRICQIVCRTEPAVLLQRRKDRVASGTRHPGHCDEEAIADFDPARTATDSLPLELSGSVIELDTTDFVALDYGALIARLQEIIGKDTH